MSDREIHHHGGATALVFGLGIGAWLVLRDEKASQHHAAAVAPRPVPVHTVIVHSVTTRVVHAGMPGWGMVVIAVVALGVACAVFTTRRSA